MKKYKNKLFSLLGIILIILSMYFFLKPYINDYLAKNYNEKQIENYNKNIKPKKHIKISKDPSKMVGYLSVPDANIKVPIYPGPATPKQLKKGVSFVEKDESLNDQNIAIAGHTYINSKTYQFSNLSEAKINSNVYFTLGKQVRKYKITKIYDVKPNQIEILNENKTNKRQLTLITCDEFNEQTNMWEKRKIFIAKSI